MEHYSIHSLLNKSGAIKIEAAIEEPVGEDPLPHHVDEVEALAHEEPPGVAVVNAPIDVKQEKSQAQRHPIDGVLIYGPEFHTSTDVCHEASLLALPQHPEMEMKLGYATFYRKGVQAK